jgi:hypothetical protein
MVSRLFGSYISVLPLSIGEEIGYPHSPWSALPILPNGFGATPYDLGIFLAGCGEWTCGSVAKFLQTTSCGVSAHRHEYHSFGAGEFCNRAARACTLYRASTRHALRLLVTAAF